MLQKRRTVFTAHFGLDLCGCVLYYLIAAFVGCTEGERNTCSHGIGVYEAPTCINAHATFQGPPGRAPSGGQSETAAQPVCVTGYAAEYLCELTREHHFRFAALTHNLIWDTLFPPHAAAWFLLATLAFSIPDLRHPQIEIR